MPGLSFKPFRYMKCFFILWRVSFIMKRSFHYLMQTFIHLVPFCLIYGSHISFWGVHFLLCSAHYSLNIRFSLWSGQFALCVMFNFQNVVCTFRDVVLTLYYAVRPLHNMVYSSRYYVFNLHYVVWAFHCAWPTFRCTFSITHCEFSTMWCNFLYVIHSFHHIALIFLS